MEKVALIAGAGGIVGQAMVEELANRADWKVLALSRRASIQVAGIEHVRADLSDQASLVEVSGQLKSVTHVFYTAYSQRKHPLQEIEPNLQMLQNLVEVLEPVAKGLTHVQLVHGSKWYGSHRGPYRTPAREDDPRHPLPIFYYSQQDWLVERQKNKPWTWSAVRPHGIWGFAIRSQLNMMQALAVYATVLKHMGLPLYYPGKRRAFEALYQCTEASHLARAMLWIATTRSACNNAYNVTNGDFIRWKYAWPLLAEWFKMDVGDVTTFDVSTFMADKEPMWQEICKIHGLRNYEIKDLTTWDAAISYMFNAEWDQMSALTKVQQAGWTEVVDTYAMIPRQLDRLVRERVIPKF